MTRTLRRGFTLVELMVVMALTIALAGLTVAVAESGAFGSQKVVSAGDRASGWLLIARQRAIRDQRPRGVRFLLTQPDPANNPYYFTAREAQYIEVPDSWVPDRTKPTATRAFLAYDYQESTTTPGQLFPDTWIDGPSYARSATTPNGHRVFAVFPDPAEQAEFLQRVSAGGLLTLPATGATFRIDQILGPVPVLVGGVTQSGYDLVLGKNTANQPPYPPKVQPTFTYPDLGAAFTKSSFGLSPPQATATEYNFAFTAGFSGGTTGTGGPQPLYGEPTLQLTGNAVIDVRVNNTTFATRAGNMAASPPEFPAVFPTSAGVTPAGGNQFIDILFSPSGQVLGASDGLICLWVRDPDKAPAPRYYPSPAGEARSDAPANTQGFDYAGEQKLVVVYPRTGLIATHPILPPPLDPYTAARDGLNSGL